MKNETRPIPKKLMAKLFAVFLLFGIAFSLFAVAVGGSGLKMHLICHVKRQVNYYKILLK